MVQPEPPDEGSDSESIEDDPGTSDDDSGLPISVSFGAVFESAAIKEAKHVWGCVRAVVQASRSPAASEVPSLPHPFYSFALTCSQSEEEVVLKKNTSKVPTRFWVPVSRLLG